jgi:hypothetical protein
MRLMDAAAEAGVPRFAFISGACQLLLPRLPPVAWLLPSFPRKAFHLPLVHLPICISTCPTHPILL